MWRSDVACTWVARGVIGVCVLAGGCAADAGTDVGGNAGTFAGSGAGVGGASGDGVAGSSGSGDNANCIANDTQACTCFDGSPGRRLCSSAAVWSLCDCGGGSAGAGGSMPFDPSLNPPGNSRADINFEWNETVTDNCEAGRYEGSFMCTYVAMGGDPSTGMLVSGPIAMTLVESENGEFLEITEGRLDGNTYGIINFTSALSGRLNCSTKQFGARAENGLWGPFIPINPFDGVLDARYDDVTSTLSGNWSLNEMLTMGICSGPWTARRVGP